MAFHAAGMYYVHGRWFNPWTGRFISPDEKGEYLYGSGNDPINWVWVARRRFLGIAVYQSANILRYTSGSTFPPLMTQQTD